MSTQEIDTTSRKLKTGLDDSEKLKNLVAKGLSDTIRYSVNIDMRKLCLGSLQVKNSFEVEEQLQKLFTYWNQDQIVHIQPTTSNSSNKRPKTENSNMWLQDIQKDLNSD